MKRTVREDPMQAQHIPQRELQDSPVLLGKGNPLRGGYVRSGVLE